MSEENINQELRLKKIDEIRNDLIEEIELKMNQNELMSKKHKNICRGLNCIEHSLIAISAITGCVSISDFVSLIEIISGITSSTIGFKICVITTAIKNCKSIIKKKRKKNDEIVLLAKSRLNSIEILICKA